MLELTKSSDNSNIDDVDKTMDEINEQTENMKQIQEALSAPIGAAADFDEVINKPLYPFPTQTTFTHCFQVKETDSAFSCNAFAKRPDHCPIFVVIRS